MIEIKKLIPQHFELVKPLEVIEKLLEKYGADYLMKLARHPSGTFISDGKIVAFAGVVIYQTVGIVWLIPTQELHKRKLGLIKAMKTYIEEMPKIYNLNMLCTDYTIDPMLVRWLQFMGFRNKNNELYVKDIL